MKDTEKIVTALHLAPQLNINGLTNEILILRQQTINTAIMQELQKLMHEKGITELYAIDESKVLQLIKEHNALEIIKEKSVNVRNLIIYCFEMKDTYKDYVEIFNYCDNCWELGKELLTQEEYELLKEVIYENKD